MAAGKCKAAYHTDEWHGYGCNVTGDACMFLYPDSKACAEKYGEGPDAEEHNEEPDCDICLCPDCSASCENAGYQPGLCPNCEGKEMCSCKDYKD